MARDLVLVVEDSDDVREALSLLLTVEGYDVREAADGQEALDLLTEVRPALLLTDLMMPRVDGHELIRRVRGRPDLAGLPVVALSACGNDGLNRAAGLGAGAVLRKPFDADRLLAVLRRALSGLPQTGH